MTWRQFGKHHLDDETIDRIYQDAQEEQPRLVIYRKSGNLMHIEHGPSIQAFMAWSVEREAECQQAQKAQEAQRAQDAYTEATRNRWEKEVLRGMDMLDCMAWTDWTPAGLQQRNSHIIEKVREALGRATIVAINDRVAWAVAAARILEAVS